MRQFQLPGPVAAAPPPAKKKSGCLTVSLVLIGGTLLACCCLGGLLSGGESGTPGWVPGAQIALGTALVPPDLEPGAARAHQWSADFSRYSLGYGISTDVRAQVDDHHSRLARRLSYVKGQGNNFVWTPPPGCQPQPWRCVFDELAQENAADVAPLTELFEARRQHAQLDPRAVTQLVVGFVQNITYKQPTVPFGILPPPLVAADGWGDCDSKSLLAALILQQLGIDTVMLYSAPLAHAALGVALPGTGQHFSHGGRRYLYVESTYPGWAIGKVPPAYDKPNQWEVIPLTIR